MNVINNGDTIIWNGKNTEDVIDFCCSWDYDLCRWHNVYTNLINGRFTLSIEPSNTMRKSCFNIQLGQTVIAIVADGYRKILKAEYKEEKMTNEEAIEVFELICDAISEKIAYNKCFGIKEINSNLEKTVKAIAVAIDVINENTKLKSEIEQVSEINGNLVRRTNNQDYEIKKLKDEIKDLKKEIFELREGVAFEK